MSTSTPNVSLSYDTQVADTVAELSAAAFPRGLRAIVLTGSLARGEGTWLHESSRVRLAGDADILAIFNDRAPLPQPGRIAQLEHAAQDRLASAGIEVHLGMSPVRSDYLLRLQPTIFSYELATFGKVIWGDATVLKLAPAFTDSQIPLEDGFRLLMNRMLELLETVCEIHPLATGARDVRYRAMKLWLDMATSYLLFKRRYLPTYRGRATRLRELSTDSHALAPIPLDRFASMVAFATSCKLGDPEAFEMRDLADLSTLIDDAHSLWRWEIERVTSGGASDIDLLRQWIAAEPIAARMRGWAAVVKRSGTWRAVARMPKWIRLAHIGGPRRLIYAATSELLFAVPRLIQEARPPALDSRWNELRRNLPITDVPEDRPSRFAWRRLGRAIAFNYNRLLVPTRS